MVKTALITGITGQDGAYLAKFLISKNYKVFGSFRRVSTPNFWRLSYLGVLKDIELIPVDMIDSSSIEEAINVSQPDEIYHLAAQSFVGRSFEEPLSTGDITGIGTTRLLEAARALKRDAKIYQASTSELYGNGNSTYKNEKTPFMPESPYASAKLYSYWMAEIYRKGYGMFVSNGILFNHESPIRGLEFVSRKITNAVARIKLGLQSNLVLGNLDAVRDWGYAKDYVEAMWLMLQQDEPGNYVISTGEGHTVRELANLAFKIADLNSQEYIKSDPSLKRLIDVDVLIGDNSKAKEVLDWFPKTSFDTLIRIMYEHDFARWKGFVEGNPIVWDGPLYQDNVRITSVRQSLKA
ncbi:MAG: GDP-mannose 4,6-dehydratase [Thermoplasmatales archaeon]